MGGGTSKEAKEAAEAAKAELARTVDDDEEHVWVEEMKLKDGGKFTGFAKWTKAGTMIPQAVGVIKYAPNDPEGRLSYVGQISPLGIRDGSGRIEFLDGAPPPLPSSPHSS